MHQVAYLTRPRPPEIDNGDAVVVRGANGVTLFGVIDALGHGRHAAVAAKIASRVIEEADPNDDPVQVLEKVHAALMGTRGAAALVGRLRGTWLDGCSVGNVEMRVHGSVVPIVQSPGVLGVRVHRYRAFRGELNEGSRVIVHSDGVSPKFAARELMALSPDQVCRYLIETHGRPHDDASVLVADVGR